MVRIAAAAAVAYWGGGFGADFLLGTAAEGTLAFSITKGAVGGFGAGLVASGGDFKAALIGGLTGARFGWAGKAGLSVAQRTFAHGVVGGVSSEALGGKFGVGFFSAGFSKLATPYVNNISTAQGRVVASAIIGGTASEIAGGKFGNGAMTAAFGRLYNEESPKNLLDAVMRVPKLELGAALGAGLEAKFGPFHGEVGTVFLSRGFGLNYKGFYGWESSELGAQVNAGAWHAGAHVWKYNYNSRTGRNIDTLTVQSPDLYTFRVKVTLPPNVAPVAVGVELNFAPVRDYLRENYWQ